LDFYIDDQLRWTWNKEGPFTSATNPIGSIGTSGFFVPKGTHRYRWVYTELNNENTWDFCEIDWIQLTNWFCKDVRVVPYCEPGGGDKCVESLIKCLLHIWKEENKKKACVIGKRKIWLFT
jgi:hypothetical protein